MTNRTAIIAHEGESYTVNFTITNPGMPADPWQAEPGAPPEIEIEEVWDGDEDQIEPDDELREALAAAIIASEGQLLGEDDEDYYGGGMWEE